MSKLSGIGGNPEALTAECTEDSMPDLDVQHWLLEQKQTNKHSTIHMLPSSVQKFLVHSVKELEVQ